MDTFITFDKVSRYYQEKEALVDISAQIEAAEWVYLIGHSGAGKSTLLKLIALQDQPCEGAIKINGINLAALSVQGANAYRQKIGFVHQAPRFIDDFSLAENVALPLRLRGISYPEAQRRVRAILYKVGLLNRAQDYFYNLSGGERQRAEIARALIHQPMILLADEPTGHLNRELSIEIMQIFQDCHQAGTTIIMATHDQGLMQQYPGRCFKLHDGRLTISVAQQELRHTQRNEKEAVCL
jgi:cell division transport system ATP-binding protein